MKPKICRCPCDLCVKWGPLQRRILAKLRGRDRKLFEEFLMMEMQQAEDLGAAKSKLAGDWPGWERMKVAVPLLRELERRAGVGVVKPH